MTQIQVVVHFGDTDDSCRVTQRLKLEMSSAVRTASLLLASLHSWEDSLVRGGLCCSLDTKKITGLMRFAKWNYKFLWIWNGHSFPDPCSLPTSNSFWSLQSLSHFEYTIFEISILHSMNSSIPGYAQPYIHAWHYKLWQEINKEELSKPFRTSLSCHVFQSVVLWPRATRTLR